MSVIVSSYASLLNMGSSTMVRAQMLSELEEIIAYKQYADQPERQQAMRRTWMKRFVEIAAVADHFDVVIQASRLSA